MRGDGVQPDGGLIRWMRGRVGWSQEELAQLADVSLRTVTSAEKGKAISRSSLQLLARALSTELKQGLDWRDLLTLTDVPTDAAGKELFIINEDSFHVTVYPVAKQSKSVRHGDVERVVVYDRVACHRQMTIYSGRSQRSGRHCARYMTRQGGYIEDIRTSFHSESTPREAALHEEYGSQFEHWYTPRPWVPYEIEYIVYRPIDYGHRDDLHYHLSDDCALYRKQTTTLDIRGYLKAGFVVIAEPRMTYYRDDIPHNDLYCKRMLGDEVENISKVPGVYTWELRDIHTGVVNIHYDYRPPKK